MTSPTDDKLQTIAVTATSKNFTAGFAGTPYTVKNTGINSVFYRQKDPAITFAGTAAVLTATPFFMAELKPNHLFYVEGASVAVVCATGFASVLSILPYQRGSDTVEELQLERHVEIEQVAGGEIADWAKHADLAALASSVKHIPHNDHTTSIQIEKTGTSAAVALMSRADLAVDAGKFEGPLDVSWAVNGTDWTDVAYVVLRLGTSASHYNEWKLDPVGFSTTAWTKIGSAFIDSTQTGNGLDLSNIAYIALGVQMDGSGNTTSAPIQFDFVHFLSAPFFTPGTAIIVDAGNVANTVRIAKIGSPANATAATGAGAVDSGTQRQTLASDDILVTALSPPLSTALVSAITTDAEWTSASLGANTVFADVSLDGASAYMVCQDVEPTDADIGAVYQPGIVYRIPTRDRTKIWIRRFAGTNTRIHLTDFNSA